MFYRCMLEAAKLGHERDEPQRCRIRGSVDYIYIG